MRRQLIPQDIQLRMVESVNNASRRERRLAPGFMNLKSASTPFMAQDPAIHVKKSLAQRSLAMAGTGEIASARTRPRTVRNTLFGNNLIVT
jgi:hypothetical protein